MEETFGKSIYHRRLIMGLKREEVCAYTKLSAAALEALERDRFELLPHWSLLAPALRRMAQYYGFAPDEFIEEFQAEAMPGGYPFEGPQKGPAEPPAQARKRQTKAQKATMPPSGVSPKAVAGAGVALAMVVGLGVVTTGIVQYQDATSRQDSFFIQGQEPQENPLEVSVVANRQTRVRVRIDRGLVSEISLKKGQRRAWNGKSQVEVELANDTAAQLSVNQQEVRIADAQGADRKFLIEPALPYPKFNVTELHR